MHRLVAALRVFAIVDIHARRENPLGEAVETFVRREDAERFLTEVRRRRPCVAADLRIEERELDAEPRN